MTAPWPVGLFLLISGAWLTRACWRGSDEQWGRLSVNWPVPWTRLAPGSRRLLRSGGAAVGFCLALLGLVLLAPRSI